MFINKFTTGFSGEKVSRTPVVLKMAFQFREKKWTQSSDIYFIEKIPKTSKNAAHVVKGFFLLKAPQPRLPAAVRENEPALIQRKSGWTVGTSYMIPIVYRYIDCYTALFLLLVYRGTWLTFVSWLTSVTWCT